MRGAVPDADELPPDAIMRRETHQVHAKEKRPSDALNYYDCGSVWHILLMCTINR